MGEVCGEVDLSVAARERKNAYVRGRSCPRVVTYRSIPRSVVFRMQDISCGEKGRVSKK